MNVRLNLILLAAALAAQPVFAQGPLTPPGAPAPMMKTLAQVEPRTAITNVPYTISQPGSYYLATNMVSASAGVTIATNWVTLDLMGFTLAGNRSGGGHGVWIYSGSGTVPVQGVTVCNGSIRGFSYGIQAKFSQGARFEDLSVSSNLNYGLNLDGLGGACDGNVIAGCSFTGNGLAAIHLDGSSGQCNGNRIAQCVVAGNNSDGIGFYALSGQCSGNLIADCALQRNGRYGIDFNGDTGQCNGNLILRCIIGDSVDSGIYLMGDDGQCNGNRLADCTLGGNDKGIEFYLSSTNGQCDGNAIVGCTVGESADIGIDLGYADGNRVEGNHVASHAAGTTTGIDTTTTQSNLFLRNFCAGHVFDFMPNANDTYGPAVTNSGELATSGAAFHPWANFTR